MAKKMFFLCFTLMEASGSSPCNIAYWAKAALSFDPPNIKLHLLISLNMIGTQVISYKMSVKEYCQILITRLSQIFFVLQGTKVFLS